MDKLIELLPAFLAGLLPALPVFATSILALVRNFKNTKHAEELMEVFTNVKKGNINVNEMVEKTKSVINLVQQEFLDEFKKIKDDLINDLKSDIQNIILSVDGKIKKLEEESHKEVLRIREEYKQKVLNLENKARAEPEQTNLLELEVEDDV